MLTRSESSSSSSKLGDLLGALGTFGWPALLGAECWDTVCGECGLFLWDLGKCLWSGVNVGFGVDVLVLGVDWLNGWFGWLLVLGLPYDNVAELKHFDMGEGADALKGFSFNATFSFTCPWLTVFGLCGVVAGDLRTGANSPGGAWFGLAFRVVFFESVGGVLLGLSSVIRRPTAKIALALNSAFSGEFNFLPRYFAISWRRPENEIKI